MPCNPVQTGLIAGTRAATPTKDCGAVRTRRRVLARGVRDASSLCVGRPSSPPYGGRPGCPVSNSGA
eukprot:12470283-Alexandrium_andersonii.AAC.1